MDSVNISQSEFDLFRAKHGRKGVQTLEYVKRYEPFFKDLETKGGMFLVQDLMTLMEVLLKKNVAELLTEKERAEYKAQQDLFLRWESKYAAFRSAAKKIKENRLR